MLFENLFLCLIFFLFGHNLFTPLDNKITVFNSGSSKGFIGSIPAGGH